MPRTVVIDDEYDSVVFLVQAIKTYCPEVTIVATATTVADGVSAILSHQPELVLLDVELSPGSGFDILSKIPERNFEVIFITAHSNYAIEAFRHSAVDYLLKPLDVGELVAAIKKVCLAKSRNHNLNFNILLENLKAEVPDRLAIPTSQGYEYIHVSEIIRLEADRSYCQFYLTNQRKILVSRCLNDYQQILDTRKFFRIHHSFLINLYHVKAFSRKDGGFVEMVDGSQIPIARRKRDFFINAMKKLAI